MSPHHGSVALTCPVIDACEKWLRTLHRPGLLGGHGRRGGFGGSIDDVAGRWQSKGLSKLIDQSEYERNHPWVARNGELMIGERQ
jgi:hypothetical protein